MTITTGERIKGALFDEFVLIFQAALIGLGLCVVWTSATHTIDLFGVDPPENEIALGACLTLIGILVGIAVTGWSLSNMLSYIRTIQLRSQHESEVRWRAAAVSKDPAR